MGRGLGEGGREPIQFGVDERSDGVLNDVQIGQFSDGLKTRRAPTPPLARAGGGLFNFVKKP